MIKINKGDTVDIVAPAGFSSADRLIAAVNELGKWGLQCRSKIDFESFHPYHSDEDDVRIADLKAAIQSDSKIIWCLRGGYGSARLLSALSKMKKPKQKKILIGYSDITALHLFFNQKWGWETIHGPMITAFSDKNLDQQCLKELKDQLIARKNRSLFKLSALNEKAEKSRSKISGKLIGGNLAIVQSLLGTKYKMNSKGKIVFLEDINEKGYQIDRMLNHLQMSEALKGAKAIIFGEFLGGQEVSGENYVNFALTRFALAQKIPVYLTCEFGHGSVNRPLICGHTYSITQKILST